MSFWDYLLKNKLWLLLGFILLCVAFALVWKMQGAEAVEFRGLAIGVGAVVLAWLIGNWVSWHKLK